VTVKPAAGTGAPPAGQPTALALFSVGIAPAVGAPICGFEPKVPDASGFGCEHAASDSPATMAKRGKLRRMAAVPVRLCRMGT
jgi:hypothetical protein